MDRSTSNVIVCLLVSMCISSTACERPHNVNFQTTLVIKAEEALRTPVAVIDKASDENGIAKAVKPQESLLTKALAAAKLKPAKSIGSSAAKTDSLKTPTLTKKTVLARAHSTQPIAIPYTSSQARMKADECDRLFREREREENIALYIALTGHRPTIGRLS